MRINHNIPALRALHQLDKSNSRLDRTLERLSSGLRINHAADDAAGLAITQKMDTQVRGLEQANRNAMDGISLIQTAEGALNEVHSMLQRIRELSVQVSNGTYDASDRKSVQDEVKQLQNEIQRISESIEFNEMKLLNGDIDRRAFSTNSDIAEIVSMSDTVEAGTYEFDVAQLATRTSDIGGSCTLFDGDGKSTVAGTLNINGEQIKIETGQTSEQVFSSIRDLASRVDASVSIQPAPPYGNGKALKLENNQYGPRKLEVTGDLQLLQALGLDEAQFNPNTESVYSTTSANFSGGITVGGTGTGSVYINGINVSFSNGDTTDAILAGLRTANIPGCEFALDSTSDSIIVHSKKPLYIKAVTTSTEDTDLAAALTSLQTAPADAIAADSAKSVAAASIDTTATLVAGSNISVIIDDGNVATNGTLTVPVGGLDLSTVAGRENLIVELNSLGLTNTAFTYDETSSKITAYNSDGYKVTMVPADATVANDVDAAKAMGFENSDVSVSRKFGNLGRDVQIDTSSIVFDDPLTLNVIDGFPEGTTVTTIGRDIIFQSNNNFELRLVSGDTIGNVTMNLLETGPLDLQIGANEGQFMEIRIQNLSPRALGITDINLSTSEGAQEAIGIIDTAINTISTVRSKLGAYQNRLEHTIANLEAAAENMTSSLSRILDADMALEMANFTQQNIIAQAGNSMLAQANQRPQSLLQLLQG